MNNTGFYTELDKLTHDRLNQILKEQHGYDPMVQSSHLQAEMDSLDLIEYIMAIEEFYDIEIDDSDFGKIDTFYELVKYISDRIERGECNVPKSDLPTKSTMNNSDGKIVVEPIRIPTERQREVFLALLDERAYQESIWNENSGGAINTPNEWLIYIQRYLNKAVMDENNQGHFGTMDQIRKIGAMCVAAMEQNEIVEREK